MSTFWVAFVICWFASILLIVAFVYGSSERRQCEHKRCLTSPPHYCIDCGMQVSEEHALIALAEYRLAHDNGNRTSLDDLVHDDGWHDPFTYKCIGCGHRMHDAECTKCGHI